MVLLDIMKSVKFRFSPSGYCLSAVGLTRSSPGWMFCISKHLVFFEHPPLKISEAHKCCHRKDKKDEHEKGLKLIQKIENSLPGESNGSHTKAKKDEHVYELKLIEELLRSMVKFKYEEKDLLSDGEDRDVLYKRWKIFFNINEAGNEKEEEHRKRTFQQNGPRAPCPFDLRDAGLPLEIGAVDLKNSRAPLVHLPQVTEYGDIFKVTLEHANERVSELRDL